MSIIVKKILIATSFVFLLSANAFAKTEGHYVGLSIIEASSDLDKPYLDDLGNNVDIAKDSNTSFGIDYKYAVNFDNIFIAPVLFYDRLDLAMNDRTYDFNGYPDSVSIKSRRGARLDLGYDIDDKFAVFAGIGLISTEYAVDWPTDLTSAGSNNKSSRDSSGIMILGLKYEFHDHFALVASYDVSEVTVTDPTTDLTPDQTDFKVEVYKLGVNYKF